MCLGTSVSVSVSVSVGGWVFGCLGVWVFECAYAWTSILHTAFARIHFIPRPTPGGGRRPYYAMGGGYDMESGPYRQVWYKHSLIHAPAHSPTHSLTCWGWWRREYGNALTHSGVTRLRCRANDSARSRWRQSRRKSYSRRSNPFQENYKRRTRINLWLRAD